MVSFTSWVIINVAIDALLYQHKYSQRTVLFSLKLAEL